MQWVVYDIYKTSCAIVHAQHYIKAVKANRSLFQYCGQSITQFMPWTSSWVWVSHHIAMIHTWLHSNLLFHTFSIMAYVYTHFSQDSIMSKLEYYIASINPYCLPLYEEKMPKRIQLHPTTPMSLESQIALTLLWTCSHKVRCWGSIMALSPKYEHV